MDKSRALPFQGIYPMLYAFWREDGRLDEAAMERQVEHAIAAGAHGIAIMGLVTEVHRMDAAQRLATIRLVGRLLAGRLPYSVTVPGEAADEQAAFAQACIEAGADWLVLQPPASRKLDEDELIAWFAGVSETIACPIGVQNNPEHLLNAFSAEGLMRLHAEVPKIVIVKGEGPVAAMEPMVAPTAATLSTFGGHGGLEHISLLRAGRGGAHPGAGLPAAAGACARIVDARRCRRAGGGGSHPARDPAAHRVHEPLDRRAALLRPAVHGAAPGP